MTGDVDECPYCGAMHQSASQPMWHGTLGADTIAVLRAENARLRDELIHTLRDVGAEFTPISRENVRRRAAERIKELQNLTASDSR